MTTGLKLDHLVVTAPDLASGAAHVEKTLGVELSAVGTHAFMGTHNRLLSLGLGLYLEVIAIDPNGNTPPHPRWFNMDNREPNIILSNWACRTKDLESALKDAPTGTGQPRRFNRGRYTWQMALPDTGRLPFDDIAPALLQWETGGHPTELLPDVGCRLITLEVRHPDATLLGQRKFDSKSLDLVDFVESEDIGLVATILTPTGEKRLS